MSNTIEVTTAQGKKVTLSTEVGPELTALFAEPCPCNGKAFECDRCGGTRVTVIAKNFFKKLQRL